MMVLQLVWVKTMVIKTKGVPLEQVQRRLGVEYGAISVPRKTRDGDMVDDVACATGNQVPWAARRACMSPAQLSFEQLA